jgi:hypothetical protein
MTRPAIDETGKRYGRLEVVRRTACPAAESDTGAYWLCRCDCGLAATVRGVDLRRGHTTSCGCQAGRSLAQRQSG